ncbi:MAG: hypothetical protein NW226_23685 [Microscillaceae bacterium]|nr:hypothetical protein [Microscillaceae bacterium]
MEINNENKFEWIERYIENDLNEEELQLFKQELARDETLREDLKTQQGIDKLLISSLEHLHLQKNLDPKKEEYKRDFQAILAKNPDLLDLPKQTNTHVFFSRLTRRPYLSIAAIFLILLTALPVYQIFWGEDKAKPGTGTLVTDTLPKESEEKPITDSRVGEKDTAQETQENPEQVEDIPLPEANTKPKLAYINEYTIRQRLGLAGSPDTKTAERRAILLYSQNPSGKQKLDPSKTYYLFRPEDTLRFYGNIQPETLKLIFVEQPKPAYLLVKGKDTLDIVQYTRWQELPQKE